MPAPLRLWLGHSADKALYALVPWFLLVDAISGGLLQLSGSSFGVAVAYKLGLLLLMTMALCCYRPRWLYLLLALPLLLLGPALQWLALFSGSELSGSEPAIAARFIQADLQLALKIISPLLALAYLYDLQQRLPEQAWRLCRNSLFFAAAVLLVNTLLGLCGLGFNAYQPLEGVAQSFLGIKGFFYSTNELSAVLLILTTALLATTWAQHKLWYLLISLSSLLVALLLLTKTGVFGVLILTLGIALLQLQPGYFLRYKRGLQLMALLLSAALLLLWLNAEAVLRLLGMYDKLQFVYQQRGISGILLSSRDYYAGRIWQLMAEQYSGIERALGVGQGGVALHLKKYFAELDWFDLLIFHGIAGLAMYLLVFSGFFALAWQQRHNGVARSLLLLNLLLLLVSALAGHILTSGMVWLPWALCSVYLIGRPRPLHSDRTLT